MAGDRTTLDQFQPLVLTARTAFQTDPAYAIAIAQQASTLLSRRETRQEKSDLAEDSRSRAV